MAGGIVQGTMCYTSLLSCALFVFHLAVKALLTQTDPVSVILKSHAGAKWQEATKLSSLLQRVEVLPVMSSPDIKVTFLITIPRMLLHKLQKCGRPNEIACCLE